jgi:hypothetical protein
MRHWAGTSLAAVGFVIAVGAAAAQSAGAADPVDVQAIIARQMDAFKRDDAAGAYGFASAGIKALFPTPAGFLAMVRDQYKPVYRPKSIVFGALKATPAGLQQTVAIIDADRQAWTAVYTFTKEADGLWHISGCALIKAPQTSV